MAPVKEHDIAARVQALTLHATGHTRKEIERLTGYSDGGFGKLLLKAKRRGYVPGSSILLEYVVDQKGRGRKEVLTVAKKEEIVSSVTWFERHRTPLDAPKAYH